MRSRVASRQRPTRVDPGEVEPKAAPLKAELIDHRGVAVMRMTDGSMAKTEDQLTLTPAEFSTILTLGHGVALSCRLADDSYRG